MAVLTAVKGQKIRSGHDILAMAHKKYEKAPCPCYTFSQKNTHYKADTISGTSEWHEVVEFPDRFRIHFGSREKGNYVQFRNDSVYNYRKNELVRSGRDTNNLLLLLGGMFYRSIDDVSERLKKAGYDLSRFSEQKWNGAHVYVIGAVKGDTLSNQFWLDKKDLKILRIIERMNEKDMMDMRFEAHQPSCKGYMETKVSFRRNSRIEQVEEYFDINEGGCD